MRGLKPPKRRERPNSVFAAQVRVNAPPPDLSGYAPLASPALTGTPTAPTPPNGDSSTRLATTAFVAANGGAGLGVWQTPTLLHSWVPYDLTGVVAVPQYRKDPNGMVYLRGAAKGGTLPSSLGAGQLDNLEMFLLPVGYRPAYRMELVGAGFGGDLSASTPTRINIRVTTAGQVFPTFSSASAILFGLDGICFLAEM